MVCVMRMGCQQFKKKLLRIKTDDFPGIKISAAFYDSYKLTSTCLLYCSMNNSCSSSKRGLYFICSIFSLQKEPKPTKEGLYFRTNKNRKRTGQNCIVFLDPLTHKSKVSFSSFSIYHAYSIKIAGRTCTSRSLAFQLFGFLGPFQNLPMHFEFFAQPSVVFRRLTITWVSYWVNEPYFSFCVKFGQKIAH